MKHLVKKCLLGLSLFFCYNAEAQTEVTYYTSMGDFKILLTDPLTPRTVDSFLVRVTTKFYDGLIFHRVIDGFMIQGGDPLGNCTGGPGYYTPDEFHPSLKNTPGALAMANSGPHTGTNGSQFYINLVNNTHLNNNYVVFGMVTSGFTVVQDIGHVATNSTDKPLTDVVIDSIRVTQYPVAVSRVATGVIGTIYPNPSRGVFTIDMPEAAKVVVTDMQGREVYSTNVKGRSTIDVSDKPAGLYFVRATNAHGTWEGRLIVQ